MQNLQVSVREFASLTSSNIAAAVFIELRQAGLHRSSASLVFLFTPVNQLPGNTLVGHALF
jgi:hypothetical protein